MEAVDSDSENESPEHLESGIKRKRKEESTDQIHCLKQKVKRLRLRLEEQREHCRMEVQAAYDLNSFEQLCINRDTKTQDAIAPTAPNIA